MANVQQKNGVYHVRFRFGGQQFKRSLKTTDAKAAKAAHNVVEVALYRLNRGWLQCPSGIDIGDFIVSGGTLTAPTQVEPEPAPPPSVNELVPRYLEEQKPTMAESYHVTQAIHLKHLIAALGPKATEPCDRVTRRELEQHLQARLRNRKPTTVANERITVVLFFKWLAAQGYLETSPATELNTVKGSGERGQFRTLREINTIIERGGLSAEEATNLWDCLYLGPEEIADLLATVRERQERDFVHLLHQIPAYTGMRRGEVLRLTWQDVNLEQDCVFARSRKQSRSRTMTGRCIDLHPELKRELLAWRKRRPRGQFVLSENGSSEPLTNDRANYWFWQPMRGTSWCLDNRRSWFMVGFHTYRHSFASNLAAAGVDQRVIDEWMGHQTLAMQRRYRHLFPSQRRDAITSFSLATATA